MAKCKHIFPDLLHTAKQYERFQLYTQNVSENKGFEMWRNIEKYTSPWDGLYWNILKKQAYTLMYLNKKLKYTAHEFLLLVLLLNIVIYSANISCRFWPSLYLFNYYSLNNIIKD